MVTATVTEYSMLAERPEIETVGDFVTTLIGEPPDFGTKMNV